MQEEFSRDGKTGLSRDGKRLQPMGPVSFAMNPVGNTSSGYSLKQVVIAVLRQLNRDKVPISTKAKGKMISFIRRFYNNVSEQAKRSKKFKRSCTIGSKELQNALKRVMRKKEAMELVRTIRKVSRRRPR
ncbi:UNVERIFIED_CONTAM: hypothetical protein K2H54_059443 [Gekko kuhli]